MRSFPFRFQSRQLTVAVVAIDEAWELWVSENDRRVAYGGKVTVDEAIAGWRVGEDRVQEMAEEVKSFVLTGKLGLGWAPRGEAPPVTESAAAPDLA